MTGNKSFGANRRGIPWRVLGWSGAALLLLLPAVANAPWTGSDFVFAAVLIGGVGLMLEVTVGMSPNAAYRGAAVIGLGAVFSTIWANAAVGMIGSPGNPLNLMFAGVLAVALLGAVLARFRAQGMGVAMAAAGVAQLLAGGVGTSTDLRGGILSACFAGLWLLSGFLFGKAARDLRSPANG